MCRAPIAGWNTQHAPFLLMRIRPTLFWLARLTHLNKLFQVGSKMSKRQLQTSLFLFLFWCKVRNEDWTQFLQEPVCTSGRRENDDALLCVWLDEDASSSSLLVFLLECHHSRMKSSNWMAVTLWVECRKISSSFPELLLIEGASRRSDGSPRGPLIVDSSQPSQAAVVDWFSKSTSWW